MRKKAQQAEKTDEQKVQ